VRTRRIGGRTCPSSAQGRSWRGPVPAAPGAGEGDVSPPRRPRPQADLSPRGVPGRAQLLPQPQAVAVGRKRPGLRRGSLELPVVHREAGAGPRMSDGSAAGLVSGRSVAEEMQAKRERDASRFALMQAEVSGRGAQTVFRDKSGKKVSNLELHHGGGRGAQEAAAQGAARVGKG